MPCAILEVRLTNRGKVAAQNIAGWLYVRTEDLTPIYFPELHVGDISGSDEDGFCRIRVRPIPELLHGDDGTFLIGALRGSNPGKSTTIKYAFITPVGIGTAGERTVELSPWSSRSQRSF